MKSSTPLYFLTTMTIALIICIASGYRSADSDREGNANPRPPLLKGLLRNAEKGWIILYKTDSTAVQTADTLPVKNGEFSIPSGLIDRPEITFLYLSVGERELWIPCLLAPDYRLSLEMDFSPKNAGGKMAVWTGRGSAANRYYAIVDSTLQRHPPFNKQSSPVSFDQWYRNLERSTDSALSLADNSCIDPDDAQLGYFKGLTQDQVRFTKLSQLMYCALDRLDSTGAAETDAYISANFPRSVLNNISDDAYLASPAFQDLMGLSYSYLFYEVKHDRKIGADTLNDRYIAHLKKIDRIFRGRVKDFVLYRFIKLNLLAATNSYERFRQRSMTTMPYIEKIGNGFYRRELATGIDSKTVELSRLRIGDPAPSFLLPDKYGKIYTLADFKGRLVILDFWASWCGPCRKETPYLSRLYTKYKANNRIQFISIAIRDKKEAWLKALKQDEPEWLQLYDAANSTGSYHTNAIPKFVLVDKNGLIADFEAPAPSQAAKLENLIEKKLGNQ